MKALVVFLVVGAAFLVGYKTGRGETADTHEELWRVTRGRDALHEALHRCAVGEVRDANGFWKAP